MRKDTANKLLIRYVYSNLIFKLQKYLRPIVLTKQFNSKQIKIFTENDGFSFTTIKIKFFFFVILNKVHSVSSILI